MKLNKTVELNTGTSEDELISLMRNNDDAALKFVYQKHYNMIEQYVLKNSGSKEDVKDLYQDAFVVFYHKLKQPDFKMSSSIGTYLFSVAKNLWLKRLRDNKVKTVHIDSVSEMSTKEKTIDENKQNREFEIATEELQKLGDPCKTLLTEFYYKQTKMEAIAKLLNYTNANRAKAQKYKCMQRLKKAVFKQMQVNRFTWTNE